MKKSKLKSYILLIVLILILSFGVSMMFKADVGMPAWDSMGAAISALTNIKIGYITMIVNGLLIITQILLSGKNYKKSNLLQIPIISFLGFVINFFIYDVFKFHISSYIGRIEFFVIGIFITTMAVSAMMCLDIVTMPPEGFSGALAYRFGIKFSKVRLSLDLIAVTVSIAISGIFSTHLYVREGTILGILIFNIFIGIFIKILNPIVKKVSQY